MAGVEGLFRGADHRDAAAIAALVNRAYRAEKGTGGWTDERELIAGPRTSSNDVIAALERGRVLLVHRLRSHPIDGCAHITVDADGAWHISMLAVDPRLQARGIGKAIKQEIERQAQKAGAVKVRLEVIRQRESLIAWYRRQGYLPTGVILPFPQTDPSIGRPLRPDLELVVMEKHLRTSC